MNGKVTSSKGGRVVHVKAGDISYNIHNVYTKDLFVRLLKSSQIPCIVKDNYDFGYIVIVPVYTIDGYKEINNMLDTAIANTLDI